MTTFMSASRGSGDGVLEAMKGGALAVIAALVGGVGDVAETIVLVAAAGASLGWIYAKLLRPFAGGMKRVYEGVGALEDLPGFMDEQRTVNEETRERLAQGSENFRAVEGRLGVLEETAAVAANAARGVARELDVTVRGDLSDT